MKSCSTAGGEEVRSEAVATILKQTHVFSFDCEVPFCGTGTGLVVGNGEENSCTFQ